MADPKNDGGEAPSSTTTTTTGDQSNAPSPRNGEDAPNDQQLQPGAATEAAPSKSTSRASSTRNSTPAASLEVRQPAPDATDASAAMDDVRQSLEPANVAPTKAKSSSKEPEQNGEALSSYGTRSRGRPGRSRPNYAEDAEMDFEAPAAPANGNVSDPPSRNSVAPDSSHASSVSGKKGSGSAQGNASWGNSTSSNTKDTAANLTVPGTSATAASAQSSASQPQPPTKRRKNAAANATNGSHQSGPAPSQAGAKRGGQTSSTLVAANSARESNMMTFENTGAILKDGHLEADDGQTVSVNGKSYFAWAAADGRSDTPATSCGLSNAF